MAKKNKKKDRAAKTKEAVKVKEVPKEPEFKVKRVRMLISCANQHRSFSPGDILFVPEDIPADTARSWIANGAAEEDKSLCPPKEARIEAPIETKIETPAETKIEEAPLEAKAEEPPETREEPTGTQVEEPSKEKK